MSEPVLISLIASLTTTLTTILTLAVALSVRRVTKQTHDLTNSKMTQLLKTTEKLAHAEGKAEERDRQEATP